MSKRVLAMALAILAFFIFIGSPFQQAAIAVALVDDALIAIMIAALAAIGITFVTTGAYDTLEEYVGSLLQEYATSIGTTTSNLFSGVQTGTNAIGQILVNNRFVQIVQTFGAWVKNKYSLANNDTLVVQTAGYNLGDMVLYPNPLIYYRTNYGATHPCQVSIRQGSLNGNLYEGVYGVYIEEINSKSMAFIYYGEEIRAYYTFTDLITGEVFQTGNVKFGLNYADTRPWYSYGFGTDIAYFPSGAKTYSWSQVANYLLQSVEVSYQPNGISIDTDAITLPYDDSAYTDGDGAVIDLQIGWGSTYDDVIDEIEGAFEDSGYADPTITYEGEEEVQDQVTDTPAQSVSQEVSDYQSPGLQSVFPFCIPFDIYAFFECLAAEPEAPSFVWRFYIPGICDEDLEIDLAAFDSAARILRTMELLLFIVGLAFVTRDKFLRG